MPPPIPDRWLNYTPVGKPIEGTRFIAFKVPLREGVNKNVEEAKRLDENILLETIPKLGMIIDLTNTTRYYNPTSFVDRGLTYRKLQTPGHDTPQPHVVRQFKDMVRCYLKKNPHNDKLIGVHCTHGVNRTGYLICNFMITELDMQPEEAIYKFNTSRGHQIERKNYLDSLYGLKEWKESNNSHCVPLIEPFFKQPNPFCAPAELTLPPLPKMFEKCDSFAHFRQEENEQRKNTIRLPRQRFGKNNTFNQSDGNNHNYSSRYVNTSRSQGGSNFSNHGSNHINNHGMHSNNNPFRAHIYDHPRYDEQPNRSQYKVNKRFSNRIQSRSRPYQKPHSDESRSSAR